ncbi:phosphotransferase family protein [Nocardioides sp. BP30]|uniref:phosphotransferase family protein n=1 Tax=Nocardioides sp. BP30 TaxID=3036374 RepID=UPI002468AF07|nr:phosphotransferase family protein [Nocardioides sp. BP30]WGL54107.1 phosphotransferase family protein [Nocardioides sp. BP30]
MAGHADRAARETRLRDALLAWLPSRLAPLGHSDFTLSDLTAPDAGYSGTTAFFTASWTDGSSGTVSRELVLRLQSDVHQVFVAPDALRQAEVMRRLGRHAGVRTPEIVATESDPAVLGAPFYLMDRVAGRVPSDVPSWHKRGWTTSLSAPERARLYDHALESLVAVHSIDDPGDLAYLRGPADPAGTTALERYLDGVVAWHAWCADDLAVGTELIRQALDLLVDSRPATAVEGVVWGDARVGNISFADDLSVAALFDWEGATTGPPDIDVGWWLMFERYLCEALGFTRQPGTPDDEGIIRRYEELGGKLSGDIGYYQLLAAVVLSLITNRLAALLIRDGLDAATAHSYPRTAVALIEDYLAAYRAHQRGSTIR